MWYQAQIELTTHLLFNLHFSSIIPEVMFGTYELSINSLNYQRFKS